MNKERRPHKLPTGCEVPYFKSNELVGVKWAGFRKRLGDQQEQFSLTDRELVRLLWRAFKPHPKIEHNIRETPGLGIREKPTDMASRNRLAVVERGSIIAALQKAKMVEDAINALNLVMGAKQGEPEKEAAEDMTEEDMNVEKDAAEEETVSRRSVTVSAAPSKSPCESTKGFVMVEDARHDEQSFGGVTQEDADKEEVAAGQITASIKAAAVASSPDEEQATKVSAQEAALLIQAELILSLMRTGKLRLSLPKLYLSHVKVEGLLSAEHSLILCGQCLHKLYPQWWLYLSHVKEEGLLSVEHSLIL